MDFDDILFNVRSAKRVFIIGNGGSHANAQHIANDLLLAGKAAFTLDSATLTATANDFGYEYIFSKWLATVAETGDCLIALSGSGKSKNILNAIQYAETIGMRVVRIFGAEHGLAMQAAEEEQLNIGHQLMLALKDAQ